MVAYSDIESIISFVNTSVPLTAGQYGVSDGNGGFIPNTNVVVDESIPPLFGYQPYDSTGTGYVLYSKVTSSDFPQYAHSQIFDSSEFPALLQGLWSNSGSSPNQPAAAPRFSSNPTLRFWPIRGSESPADKPSRSFGTI